MKRNTIFAIPVLALALPALGQDFSEGELTLGTLQKDFDTNSSKFLEYRDIPQGPVASALGLAGRKGAWSYKLWARDVTQKDQRYFGYADNGSVRFDASYVGIPHNFGNGGRSILSPVKDNEWRISDTIQQTFQNAIVAVPPSTARGQIDYSCQARTGFVPLPGCFSLLNLVTPTLLAQPQNVDLKLLRGRTSLGMAFTPAGSPFEVGVSYFHERRSGSRAANGTSFGFGNVVETPEPVRYITQDVTVNASWRGDWGTAKAGFGFNDFKNAFETFTFDNPFRILDSTDPNAYQSPSTATRNGAVFGRTSLQPDNKVTTETLGATLKLGKKTRLTGDVTFGQWKQNEDPLLAWTTNTSIRTPGGAVATTAPLPATVLDGKIDTASFGGFFTTKLTDDLGLHARYRRYDHDNKTPRYRLDDGYVRFDAVWEDIPRITVPYGFTSDSFDAYATLRKGVFGGEVGWKYTKVARTFRETTDTREKVFRVAADLRGDWAALRGIAEFGNRDHDEYHAAFAEEQSFLCETTNGSGLVPCGSANAVVEIPANQTVLRRPDQAKRDLLRVGGQLELAPGDGKFALFASYLHTKFEYDQQPVACEDVALFPGQSGFCAGGQQKPLGLIDDQYDTFTVEANFTPGERATAYAFYTWEDGDLLQDGRQSGASLDFNPANVWTANLTTKGNTVGGGADLTLAPEKWFAKLFGRYQKIDGNNDVFLQPGYSATLYTNPTLRACTAPGDSPCSIRALDDTKLVYLGGTLRYHFAAAWNASVGVGYEEYDFDDSQTENALNYIPASFFLQADNRDYQAWVGYLSLTYSFN